MKYNDVIDSLQNLTLSKINVSEIAQILNVPVRTLYTRGYRNSDFSQGEIRRIENFYNVKLVSQNVADDSVVMDYYPDVFGSCGTGYFVESEQKEQINVPVNCFLKHIEAGKKYSVINAKGDSMEPFIKSGDKLVVEHHNGEQIIDNQIYVFCYENEIFVKRLVKNVNQLIIKSDNTLYDIIKLSGDDLNKVIIIGQIIGLMRDMRQV